MKDEPPTLTNVSKRFTASAVPATNFDISAVHCYLAPRLEIIIKRNVALSSDLQDLQIDFFFISVVPSLVTTHRRGHRILDCSYLEFTLQHETETNRSIDRRREHS